MVSFQGRTVSFREGSILEAFFFSSKFDCCHGASSTVLGGIYYPGSSLEKNPKEILPENFEDVFLTQVKSSKSLRKSLEKSHLDEF